MSNPLGRPLKSGEPRKSWAARLPVSTIKAIMRLAKARGWSQSDTVAAAVAFFEART